ncbi:MAG: DegV family protein [Eubacteriales bacterium]
MSKIKLITDSACDLSREAAAHYDIQVLPLTIFHEDEQYRDWYDFTPPEFYKLLDQWEVPPTTSQVSPTMFLEAFCKARDEGYEAIIAVSLNAAASGTCQSALIARGMFYEQEENCRIPIEVIDSTSYAYLIGFFLEQAAQRIEAGAAFQDVVDYLRERYSRVQAYAIVYTLDMLKRTGRINGATNFVANLLDIKPVLLIGNAEIRQVDKVRGRKKGVAKLVQLVKENMDPQEQDLLVVCGDMPEELEELKKALALHFPECRLHYSTMGSVIALNAGPRLLGVGFIHK